MLFILLFCILLLFGRLSVTGSAIGGDGVYYYAALRSIAIDHNLDFKNEYEYFHESTSDFTKNRKIPVIPEENSITQKLPGKYPIGSAIFLLPSFLITHFAVILLGELGFGIPSDGYNIIYQGSAALSSLIYAFLGLLLIYALGKKMFEPKIAFLGTLCIWLSTPLIYYMTMEPLNSQSLSFFCVSLFIYLWFITRKNRNFYKWVILGLVGGFMSIIRYQDSLFLLIPIIDALLSKKLFMIFTLLLSATVGATSQLWANNYLFGSPFITGYTGIGFPYLASPKIFYSLFSLERGLLVWSPILSFALLGLYLFIKRFKFLGRLLLFAFLIQLYIVSSWADPSQGDSFGNRILINSNLIFALGLMQFLKNFSPYQKLILTIFSGLILLNGVLAGLFVLRIIGQPY